MVQAPHPELDDLLEMIGEAGRRLSDIEASEGAAGNISICLRWPIELRTRFPLMEEIELTQPVPELEGDFSSRLALQEELKSMPFSAVWDYYCVQKNVPVGMDFMDVIKDYEKQELAKRV